MIYCIGDSFTAGDELPDWSPKALNQNEPYPISQLAWPALLEKQLNVPVKNLGRGGCGNTRIVKRAIDATLSGADIVIVAWSNPSRIELADEQGLFDAWPTRNADTIAAAFIRSILIKWFAVHQNNMCDQWSYTAWLRQIILLQSFFKTHNQKYLMLSADPLHKHAKYRNNFLSLRNEVDPTYFIGWPNNSMLDWAHGLPKGPGCHFLEEGHQVIANKVDEYIRNFGWVS